MRSQRRVSARIAPSTLGFPFVVYSQVHHKGETKGARSLKKQRITEVMNNDFSTLSEKWFRQEAAGGFGEGTGWKRKGGMVSLGEPGAVDQQAGSSGAEVRDEGRRKDTRNLGKIGEGEEILKSETPGLC
jgi:hypothetical protein